MTRIQRATQKIFGGKSSNEALAVFGSMKTGNPIYTDNIENLQSTDYEKGWDAGIVADEAPFLEEMNGVQYGFSKQLAYLFQEGIAEYDEGTTYYTGSWCKSSDESGNRIIYESLIDDNLGNPLTDTTKWQKADWNNQDARITKLENNTLKQSDKAEITGWGLPSERFQELSLSNSETIYTAPADGYVVFGKGSTAADQNITLVQNGVVWQICWATTIAANLFVCMPIIKGHTFKATYTAGGPTQVFRFYYAEGAKP